MKKIQILQEYNLYKSQIDLFAIDKIDESVHQSIPKSWSCIVKESNVDKKCQNTIIMWKAILSNELSNTIAYLEENLCDVDLIRIDNRFYLLYTIRNEEEELLYYIGGNPMDSNMIETKPYKKGYVLSDSLKNFYTQLHNGFYEYCSKSMGIMECQNIICLDENEWGILEEIGANLLVDLSDTYTFFDNGMGDYVAIDLKKNKDVIWFHDEEPIYDNPFWDVIDEWLKIGMSE